MRLFGILAGHWRIAIMVEVIFEHGRIAPTILKGPPPMFPTDIIMADTPWVLWLIMFVIFVTVTLLTPGRKS